MYSLTYSPAYATTVAAQQTIHAVETSRLARAARLAREGRGEPDEPKRHQFRPRHRSRFVWLVGLRSNIAF
jgi:hypothetical protein